MIQYKRIVLISVMGLVLSAGKLMADDATPAVVANTTPTTAAKMPKKDSPTITAMKAAIALEDAGNTTDAVAAFEKIGVLKSKNMEAWRLNDEAHVYLTANDQVKAIALLEKAVATNDANYIAWNNLGSAYELTGAFDKAKDAYQKSVDTAKAAGKSSAKAEGNLAALTARMGVTSGASDASGNTPAAASAK